MKEYIERTELYEAMNSQDCEFSLIDALALIEEFPAADVVEVRHGKWVKPVPGDGENYCSVCKAEQPWFYGYGYFESDYCPNCGARMDKEDEHGIM